MRTFYQKDSKQNIRVWNIWVEEMDGHPTICSTSGILHGNLIPAYTPIYDGLGGRSAQEQAEADMQTEINKKIKSGYGEDINNIKEKNQTATIKKPSKGLAYHPTGADKAYTLVKAKIQEGSFIGIQRKLDGWRYRIYVNIYGECIFYTSSGDVTLGFPQIEKPLLEKMQEFYKEFGIEEIILDGEIYNHELGFQATASACGTTVHITAEKQALRDAMIFHIFDFCECEEFAHYKYFERQNIVDTYFVDNEAIVPVHTYVVPASDAVIHELFLKFLEQGFEGAIIRKMDGLYEHKKNTQFLKYKPLQDEEFEIVGFIESTKKNTLGSIVCMIDDERNVSFDCALKGELGSDKIKKLMWMNQSDYKGKFVTVEFLGWTDDKLPRHPRAKCFRKGKSED